MPIARDQFDKSSERLERTENQILEFLTQHPDEAYQVHEVAGGIGEWNPPQGIGEQLLYALSTVLRVGGTLDDLAQTGVVDKKVIDGASWYSIRKPYLKHS